MTGSGWGERRITILKPGATVCFHSERLKQPKVSQTKLECKLADLILES